MLDDEDERIIRESIAEGQILENQINNIIVNGEKSSVKLENIQGSAK